MTTYAPNFTPRLKVKYQAGGIVHTIQVRNARGTSFGDMVFMTGRIHDLFQALSDVIYADHAFISAEVALTDDDVFAPCAVPVAITGNAVVVADFSPRQRIMGLTFSGKAPGSRARFTVYGCAFAGEASATEGGDGKITSGESGVIATVAALAATNFRANSGSLAIYPNVATYKENDHLLKLVRRGIIS